MADLLFVTWDGGGNVPPAVCIASELQRRGHRVRFLGHAAQQRPLARAGHDLVPYAEADDFVGSEPASVPRLVRLFSDRGMGRDLVTEVRRRPTDLIVVDALLLGALAAAADTGLPYVPLQHLFDSYQRGGWLRGPVGMWGRARGLRPVTRWNQAPLALAATLSELDPGAERAPANLRFTGPVVDRPQRLATFTEPTVLISLSTFAYPGMAKVLQRVVDATAGLDARVVVTTGPVIDPAAIRPHARAEVHRFVPHAELMPQASLVVGHGGHGTAMRALAHDVPLLVVPMHPLLDHPVVGRAVQQHGAGRLVPKRASTARLHEAMAGLLADGPHRTAAAHLGRAIREADGARAAATLLEGLLGEEAPVSDTVRPERHPGHPSPRP